jgi:DNA-binding CsgD family transcriptional regulator/class 3 adenylate cyclase
MGDADAVLNTVQEFLAGKHGDVDADRLLLTILVADAVRPSAGGLTLTDDRWGDHLALYHDLLRRALERFRGMERRVVSGSVLATFDGPGRAIGCARATIEAAGALGIDVRAGLHTGECEVVANRLSGVAVEIATRIAARAGAGEIFVSSTVKDLVTGSGIEFAEVDVRLLTRSETLWHLFRVLGGQAPSAAASVSAVTDHAEERLSRREREVASLVAQGGSNREIAEELSISVKTVERHVANIMIKLGCHSRAQVAAWAVAHYLSRERDG